jgi:hypothetical protein
MKFYLPIILIATVLFATNVEAIWEPAPGLTWDYLLGAEKNVIKASDKNIVTIDLIEAEEFVPYFHNRGQRVICYFSTNIYYSADYKKAKGGSNSSVDQAFEKSKEKLKSETLIKSRMKKAMKYKCDAIEVDCFKNVEKESYEFAKWVAKTAHSIGISVGIKDVAKNSIKLEPYFDFVVVENCADFNECYHYTCFTRHDKAVFVVHYGNRGYSLSGSSLSKLIKEQKGRNFTCVLCPNQFLNNNCVNYDCNTGAVIGKIK